MAGKKGINLYVGFDDSNHAGTAKGEIIVATFSYLYEDNATRIYPRSRNFPQAQYWLSRPGRDMRFTLLTHDQFRHSPNNLAIVAPFLVKDVLESQFPKPSNLHLNFDGVLTKEARTLLYHDFENHFPNVHIEYFIKRKDKKGRVFRNITCPCLVYIADTLAHNINKNPTGQNFQDKKFIASPLEEMLKRMEKLRAA